MICFQALSVKPLAVLPAIDWGLITTARRGHVHCSKRRPSSAIKKTIVIEELRISHVAFQLIERLGAHVVDGSAERKTGGTCLRRMLLRASHLYRETFCRRPPYLV